MIRVIIRRERGEGVLRDAREVSSTRLLSGSVIKFTVLVKSAIKLCTDICLAESYNMDVGT